MSGVETVNDEFEVGFNQTFESHRYRAEQAGRTVMVLFTLTAGRTFDEAAHQCDALVRFEITQYPVGLIPLRRSDGTDTIHSSIVVVP